MDLETQDHILNYQLPVAVTRHNVGLVVIDSVTSNYRAEHSSNSVSAILTRSTELAKLGQMLRNLAAEHDIAIVLANQVSDRFESVESRAADLASRPGFSASLSQTAAPTTRESANASPLPRTRADNLGAASEELSPFNPPSSSPASSPYPVPEEDQFDGSYLIGNLARNETLSLLHQERFFTGWGDEPRFSSTSLKTPALGFFWSTQIACRIALRKDVIQSMTGLWEMSYPFLTPREQTDLQGSKEEVKQPDSRPGFSSARQTHSLETKTDLATAEPKGLHESQQLELPRPDAQELPSQNPPSMAPESQSEFITRRTMKLVFAPWTAGITETLGNEAVLEAGDPDKVQNEVEFEIWKGGLRACRNESCILDPT